MINESEKLFLNFFCGRNLSIDKKEEKNNDIFPSLIDSDSSIDGCYAFGIYQNHKRFALPPDSGKIYKMLTFFHINESKSKNKKKRKPRTTEK